MLPPRQVSSAWGGNSFQGVQILLFWAPASSRIHMAPPTLIDGPLFRALLPRGETLYCRGFTQSILLLTAPLGLSRLTGLPL